MFVDDAMLIEVDFPDRLEQSVNAWEHCCDMVLGTGSASQKKKKDIDGKWLEEAILLGFHVNVGRKLIRSPPPDDNVG